MPPLAALPTNTADTPEAKALREAQALQRRWVQQLDLAEKDRKDFLDDGKRIVERYRNETKIGGKARKRGMPILYANTEQLHSALYQKPAKPDVRRRFSDRDPVGQAAAEMVERALTYFDDTGDSDTAVSSAVQDLLLPGRGVVRIEYEPIIGQRQDTDPVTGQPLFNVDPETGETTDEPATVQFLADQKVHHHYVFWQDLLTSPARRWADVSWIAFRHVMTADAVEDAIYENAGPESQVYGDPTKVPLDWMPDGADKAKVDDSLKKAEVWEIWDKLGAQRLWIVKTAMMPLRVDPDPYELEGFFPMPEPITAYRTNDTIVPQALYKTYEEQAEELDEITRRISMLTRALKRRGIYDKSIPELKRLANANDNEFIASENYKNLVTNGGLAAAMQTEDISVTAGVILNLMKQQAAQIQAIYEISGISDIMRGSTDPDETLGAQQLKAQTGSMRLRRLQQAVQKFIRDLNRIKVDLLCRHFDPQVLQQITNMQVTPQIMQSLQNDALRGYMVDIETDSTVFADAAQMQQSRSQLLQGVTQLWQAWAPIVQQRPQLAPLLFKMTEFGIAPAHDARMVQDAIDKAQQDLEQAQQAPPPGQQPNPAALANAQAAQAKAQAAQAKAQSDVAKNQTAVQVAQIQAQGVATKAQAEVQRTALQVQSDREQHAQTMAHAEALHQQTVGQTAQQHALDVQRQLLQQAAQQAQAPTGPVDQGGGGL
jgi:hypothetical protein